MELAGKIVVVTGASMGIGEAIAKILPIAGQPGDAVARRSRVEAARGRVGMRANAGDGLRREHREEIDRAIGLTMHHFQRIDVWVNNAGHGLLDSVAEMDSAAFREMFDTNFFGAVAGMQAVIPIMRQQGGGTIINISSVAGTFRYRSMPLTVRQVCMNAIGKAAESN